MDGSDFLGYGTHLILDGFRADPAPLADAALLDGVLRGFAGAMHETAEVTTVSVTVRDRLGGGVSAALVAAESQLCVHTFTQLGKLSLGAFSTRSLPTGDITGTFVERFRVGRFESRVHGRGRLLPRERARLEQALQGERDYARLRLRDLLGR